MQVILVWAVAVAAGIALVWLAIGSAGREITGGSLRIDIGGLATPTARPVSTGHPGARTTSARTTSPRTTSASPCGRPATDSLNAGLAGTGAPAAPQGSTGAGSSAASRSLTHCASTAGGAVSVTCRGNSVVDWTVFPVNGWVVRPTASARVLTVSFSNGEYHRVRVTATCASGQPSFSRSRSVSGDSGDDSGDGSEESDD